MKINFSKGLAFSFIFVLLFIQIYFIFKPSEISFSPEQEFSIRRILPENYEKGVPFEVVLEITADENFSFNEFKFFLSDVAENSEVIPFQEDKNASANNDLIFWRELFPGIYSLVYSVVSYENKINFNGRWEFNLNLSETGEGTYSGFVVGDSKIFAIAEEISQEISGGGGSGRGGGGTSRKENNISKSFNQSIAEEKNIYEVDSGSSDENFIQKEIIQKNLLRIYILISLIIFVGAIIFYFIFRKRFFEKV